MSLPSRFSRVSGFSEVTASEGEAGRSPDATDKIVGVRVGVAMRFAKGVPTAPGHEVSKQPKARFPARCAIRWGVTLAVEDRSIMAHTNELRPTLWHTFAVFGATLTLIAFSLAAPAVESQEQAAARAKTDASRPRSPRKLSPLEVEDFEKKVADNPNDLEARERLVTHYFSERGDAVRAVRARHVLWVIANAPDVEIAGRPEAGFHKGIDTENYAEARALWLRNVESNPRNPRIIANAARFFLLDDRPEAEGLFKRGAEMEPGNPRWKVQLAHLYQLQARRPDKTDPAAAKKALEQYEAALGAGSPRSEVLANAAECALWAGEDTKATEYASELLRPVGDPTGKPDGDAIHEGHRILGHVALKAGDVEGARRHLLESAKTPGSPALNSFGPELTLAKELLAKGERQAVIQYLESLPRFWEGRQEAIDEWVILIRAGKTPDLDRFRARRASSAASAPPETTSPPNQP